MENDKPIDAPDQFKELPTVEIITDESIPHTENPLVTIRTGQTNQKKIYFKINQPRGRALLIAVHL